MIIDIVMPKMGESLTEGTVLEWKKQVGESIERDDPLLEIATDKVDSEIPAPVGGTVDPVTRTGIIAIFAALRRVCRDMLDQRKGKDDRRDT